MKKIVLNLSSDKAVYFIITIVCFFYVIFNPVIFQRDSSGYMAMDISRSCGYPFVLAFHHFLLGSFYLKAITLTQFFFLAAAAYYLIHCLKKTIALHKWFLALLYILLLSPVFYEQKVANSILSEGIAYPFYLFIIGNLLVAVIEKKARNFYIALGLTYLLLLIRGQFLFLIPVFLVSILLSERKLFFRKKSLLLLFFTLLTPIIAIFTDITFHTFRHGYETTTPWTGIQIVTIPFFVSDSTDYKVFETKEQQEYFKFIYAKLKEKKLLLSDVPENDDATDFYYANYVNICNHTLNADGETFFDIKYYPEKKTIENDKLTASMVLPLVKDNFGKSATLYFRNCTKGIGTFKILLVSLILLFVSSIKLLKKDSAALKFIVIGNLLILGNLAIVALAEPAVSRYLFYNNWVLIAIIVYLFQKAILNKSNE